jgi:5-hydroxyisourate hydrolase
VSTLSTHVLDTALGKPAAGIHVTLSRGGDDLGLVVTDRDGRAGVVEQPKSLDPGSYTLTFAVGHYFAAAKRESFYDHVRIEFKIVADQHYHVPLLISPFGYSTYRGS